MNGFDFFEHFPKGMFEESDVGTAEMAKNKRAVERKRLAKKHIEEEVSERSERALMKARWTNPAKWLQTSWAC